jgi:hypothetical protein
MPGELSGVMVEDHSGCLLAKNIVEITTNRKGSDRFPVVFQLLNHMVKIC